MESKQDYNFQAIEKKWRAHWAENKTFKTEDSSSKPKFYVLDMFPYPSGAGLHVGHPLGYIASDIYARYKRLQGFNVLHPMGYDSFGLPAEQYAIQTGQHPAITTQTNISRYRDQMDQMGFSYDWDREIRTSSPEYYKWTQWIFKQLFGTWYNNSSNKAELIDGLIAAFKSNGNSQVNACHDCEITFSANDWNNYSEVEKEAILQNYRMAYLADSWVNWCPALGTVLANDEVINGRSERGNHPVEQKKMRQWSMRIKAYADRLLTDLEGLDWTDSIKDIQRNWIGKSVGAMVKFETEIGGHCIEVFTTRPDTIFGVTFMTLAPEHPLVNTITTAAQKSEIEAYQTKAALRTERDRMSDVKTISGAFTGAFVLHPLTGEKIQIWIGDYVLASYGTGAVMAVPCGDQRDYDFAKHFNIEIRNIFEGKDISEMAFAEKNVVIANSDFVSGLKAKDASYQVIQKLKELGKGEGKTNFRLRDAIFSRQRYWGEPFPVYYKDNIPQLVSDDLLPVTLPDVDAYLPTEDGEPPLARATKEAWNVHLGDRMEFNTMPGWAGSSWYFLRYMDPNNTNAIADPEKMKYWNQVDLYLGGAEHATGHLLYARFWTKFLYDIEVITFNEPFKKMINQGMILGRSSIVHAKYEMERSSVMHAKIEMGIFGGIGASVNIIPEEYKKPLFISHNLLKKSKDIDSPEYDYLDKKLNEYKNKINAKIKENFPTINASILGFETDGYGVPMHVDISMVDNDILDIEKFRNWRSENKNAEFICEENGDFICGFEVEKMSKSLFNVQTPDELVTKFGADTLRMYEMFLGPLEQSKPWDTKGITGVHSFLKRLYRLFYTQDGALVLDKGEAAKDSLKTVHRLIKRMTEDLERFSFNTGVSNFMIAVNELTDQKCHNHGVLENLVILLNPYAPHLAEELWTVLGHEAGTLSYATFPLCDESVLVENEFEYPISINGKMRFKVNLPLTLSPKEVEEIIKARPEMPKYLEGKEVKKMIVVPGKIVNVVV